MIDPDPDEEALRAVLLATILSGIARCDPVRISKIPELIGLPEIPLEELVDGCHHGIMERSLCGR